MLGRKAWASVAAVAVLAGVVFGLGGPRPGPAEAHYGSWFCQWAVTNYPVSGGYLHGRGCARWWDHAELKWQVWADTYVPQSRYIWTYVAGYDRCGTNPFKLQMQGSTYYFDTTYGTSGPAYTGAYQNCAGGHDYRENTSHWRQRNINYSWEGRDGVVCWGSC
jgi:hypothetical protein